MEFLKILIPVLITVGMAYFALYRFPKEQRFKVFHEFRLSVQNNVAGLLSEVNHYVDSQNSNKKHALDWSKLYDYKYKVAMRLLPRHRTPDLDRELLAAINNIISLLRRSASPDEVQGALESLEKRARMLSLYVWYARSYGRRKSNPFDKNYKGDKFLLTMATSGNENTRFPNEN